MTSLNLQLLSESPFLLPDKVLSTRKSRISLFPEKLPKRFDYSTWVMNIILFMDEIDNVSIDGNCTNPFNYDHFDSAYDIARAGDTNVSSKSYQQFLYFHL